MRTLSKETDYQSPRQHTLRKEVSIEGVGLHSGKKATLTLKPAFPNTGILFIRTDLDQPISIPASPEFITHTRLATTLGRGAAHISTVEHLLSAFKLLNVDNAIVEVCGAEVPIMDGSSGPFCEAILEAGVYEQAVTRKVALMKRRIEVRKGDKIAMIEPNHQLTVSARIEWNHPSIGKQNFSFCVGQDDYRKIAMARTFGFLKDVEQLKKMGLALGGSYANAVVMDEERVLNEEGLRYPDEFVRHKVLDAIGDLALAPISLLGAVTLVKAGHELHAELIQAIFSDPANYEVFDAQEAPKKTEEETEVAFQTVPSWVTAY